MAEEIYLLEENQGIVFDAEKNEEWKKTIEELDLTGQKQLLDGSGNKSPIPFQYMNKGMYNMFEVLCPCKTNAKEYSKGPIPLKVLGVIKLCEDEGYFTKLQIWSDEISPDPILVGMTKDNSWDSEYYLLARWGDMLRSFDELKEMAKKRWIETSKARLEEEITKATSNLQILEQLAIKHLNGGYVSL